MRELSHFVQSEGAVAPQNYDEYLLGSIMQDHCVFCDEKHLYAQAIYFPRGDTRPKEAGDYALRTRQNVNIGHVCTSCHEKLRQHDKTAKYFVSPLKAIFLPKIVTYVSTGLLESSYPAQLDLDFESCFFCRSQIVKMGSVENRFSSGLKRYGSSINPPVDHKTNVINAPQSVCSECHELVVSAKLRAMHFTKSVPTYDGFHTQVRRDSCAICDNTQPVTLEEYRRRVQKKTLSKHACNQCLEKYWGEPRFETFRCVEPGCKFKTKIDRTLAPELSKKDFVCSKCLAKMENQIQHILLTRPKATISITKVICGGEPRYLFSVVPQNKSLQGNPDLMDKLCANYDECDHNQHKTESCRCACSETRSQAMVKAVNVALQYSDEF